jgi:hypothetical protein
LVELVDLLVELVAELVVVEIPSLHLHNPRTNSLENMKT